ncbi:helix-turn-helix domain-containing protein [Streptosporangium lutulentum]
MEAVDRPGLEIIWKADSLVRVLSRDGESTVAQLAEAVNEPLSSTYRLLADLKQIGWVERGSSAVSTGSASSSCVSAGWRRSSSTSANAPSPIFASCAPR